jgi:hypothetical protein
MSAMMATRPERDSSEELFFIWKMVVAGADMVGCVSAGR